jgi:general secretion pathway protein C
MSIPVLMNLKSANARLQLLRERGAQLLVIVLLLALSLDAALILTRVLGDGTSPAPNNAPAAAPLQPPMNPTLRLGTVVNAHLFGIAGAAAGDAPPTTTALVLTGVLADRDPSRGQAIIGEKAISAKLYAVGASIPGGAHLRSVFADHVLIERNGAIESVLLPHTPLKSMPGAPAATPLLRTSAAGQRDNATLLAGIMRVQPVFNQGKLEGYRVFPGTGRGAGVFQQMGLRAGDMILAVNGTALDDPTRAMEVLQTLSSSGSATVTVSRGGATQDVPLDLATLGAVGEGNDAAASAASGAAPTPGLPAGQRMRFGAPPPSGGDATEPAATAPASPPAAAPPADEAAGASTNAERQR